MDEPTNHLDLRAKDVLLESLQQFQGTVVFVSHDRYFIDKLATRIIEVADGSVTAFPGNYEDYVWRKQSDLEGDGAQPSAAGSRAPSQDSASDNSSEPPDAAETSKPKRINPIRLRQMQDRVLQIEEEIARLETGISECETALTKFVSAEETQRQTELLNRRRSELEALMTEWEEISSSIEGSSAVPFVQ